MTDAELDQLVAEARDWQSRWDAGRVTPGTEVLIGGLLDAITTERAKVAALEAELTAERAQSDWLAWTLRQMIYETTSLSPLEDDGSHKCRITKNALVEARAAFQAHTALRKEPHDKG